MEDHSDTSLAWQATISYILVFLIQYCPLVAKNRLCALFALFALPYSLLPTATSLVPFVLIITLKLQNMDTASPALENGIRFAYLTTYAIIADRGDAPLSNLYRHKRGRRLKEKKA